VSSTRSGNLASSFDIKRSVRQASQYARDANLCRVCETHKGKIKSLEEQLAEANAKATELANANAKLTVELTAARAELSASELLLEESGRALQTINDKYLREKALGESLSAKVIEAESEIVRLRDTVAELEPAVAVRAEEAIKQHLEATQAPMIPRMTFQ
jgi:chromosome segregation ATPase